MPAYNAEAYIREALHSALRQTYDALEVLVVDDGSMDRTAEIVREIAGRDERVTLLQQANAGVAAARNLAIEHARGEFIAPLDADDVWYLEKLEAQVRRMEEGGEEMGMVYSWWLGIDGDREATLATTPWTVEGDVYESLVYMNFIGNASVPLFRRSALERVGFYDPKLLAQGGQGCEDWEISLRVAERFLVGAAPGYLVGYRTTPGSMSFDCDSMARSYDLVVEDVKRRHPEIPAEVLRWSEGNFLGYLASMSYAAGRFGETQRWLARSFRVDPAKALSSYTLRMALSSMLHAAGDRFGLVPDLLRASAGKLMEVGSTSTTREEAEQNAETGALPWMSGKPYDRVHARRWRFTRERANRQERLA